MTTLSAKVKLISTWFGEDYPPWIDKYREQMARFKSVDRELLPSSEVRRTYAPTAPAQISWLNRYATKKFGTPCNKRLNSFCDLRPTFGELFADLYAGYDWWGWCDIDILFGDLDRILPTLLTDDMDVLNFKPDYLSGCFLILRNNPEITGLFRKGKWQEILADPRYYVWDESGYSYLPGESLFNLIHQSGLRVRCAYDLYLYDAPNRNGIFNDPNGNVLVQFHDGRLTESSGREYLFLHFMSDVWPLTNEGALRW